MSASKIVKRYANRKLYDTERSCYVTLEDIAGMIKAGEEVRVVDNKTGEDLTSVTFAQIIFEAEKKKSFMPLGLLRDLIQNGGEQLSEFTREHAARVTQAAQELKEQARERVESVQAKAQQLRTDFEGKIERLTHRAPGEAVVAAPTKITELVHSSRRSFEELQKNVEERIKGSVGTVSRYATLGRDMEDIRQRLAALEERLGKFQ